MCDANEKISKVYEERSKIWAKKCKCLSHLSSRKKSGSYEQYNTFVMRIYSAVLPCACICYQNGNE